jgi:hypothetical protein
LGFFSEPKQDEKTLRDKWWYFMTFILFFAMKKYMLSQKIKSTFILARDLV